MTLYGRSLFRLLLHGRYPDADRALSCEDGSDRIKPDILAPGVDVLSSLPGSTYGLNEGTSMDIATQAQRESVRDLRQSGLIKVRAGVTTLEEVISVTNE